jgi:hypothetical protein
MTDMKCPGCGAEMHLIEVEPDKIKMVPGYEQHTFECSGCHDHVRRLVFIPRAIGPLNSEEIRLSAAWLGHVRRRDANYHCGSGLTDNLGPKFERANG